MNTNHSITKLIRPIFYFVFLFSVGIFLTTGCTEESEPESPSKEASFLKAKGGNGKGKGGGQGGEDPVLFEVNFSGNVISSSTTYGVEITSNKKYDLMHTDACGNFEMFGITSLVACTSILQFCDDGVGLRQFDKRRDPGHVSLNLWILDGVNGNHNFQMFGWLQDNETTLFPDSAGDSVEIVFENWNSSGPNGCADASGTFANADDATVTITRLADTECPNMGADTCP